MIRVLQVIPGLNRGGLETFVMNLFRTVDKQRVTFEFLTNMEEGDYSKEIADLGGVIHYIPPRRKGLRQFNRSLKEFFDLHGGEFDAIHYHESSLTSLEVLYYAKKSKIPVRIIHAHSSSIKGNKLHYITHSIGKLFISRLATHYFACSDKALDWMYDFTGVKHKAIAIYNGIDVKKFAYDTEKRVEIRTAMGINRDVLVVGHIGRFTQVKNHKYLIDIFNELVQIKPNSVLMLVGEGELKKEIISKVKNLRLEGQVRFLGLRADTYDLYQVMDIFVMPSYYEGLPLVLVEAQSAGLPILCSDTISNNSKLTKNYHTLSINITPKNWASKILTIMSEYVRKDETKKIIDAGFDARNVAKMLTEVYQNG